MAGILYGVGLGPGDPELITLKGWRVISLSPVIAWPEGESGQARARAIVEPFMPEDVIELPLRIPFTGRATELEQAYAEAAAAIAEHLRQGRDVAYLCLGDPLLYGTFGRLATLLAAEHRVRAVPGVSAPQAAAARLMRRLAQGTEPFKMLPATMQDDALLAECLNRQAVLAILKAGHHLPRLAELLRQAGRLNNAVVAQELGNGQERVLPLAQAAREDDASYFSLVLVWPQGAGRS